MPASGNPGIMSDRHRQTSGRPTFQGQQSRVSSRFRMFQRLWSVADTASRAGVAVMSYDDDLIISRAISGPQRLFPICRCPPGQV
jgi:hypothetical protein